MAKKLKETFAQDAGVQERNNNMRYRINYEVTKKQEDVIQADSVEEAKEIAIKEAGQYADVTFNHIREEE